MNVAVSSWPHDAALRLYAQWPAATDLLLKVSILLAAALLLDRLMRVRRPVLCGAMWNAVLVGTALLLPAQCFLPKAPVWTPPNAASAAISMTTAAASPASESASAVVAPADLVAGPSVAHRQNVPTTVWPAPHDAVVRPQRADALPQAPATATPTYAAVAAARLSPVAEPATAAIRKQFAPLWPLGLVAFYGIGVVAALVRLALDVRAARRLQRCGTPADDDDWLARLARHQESLRVDRLVALRVSASERLPLVVGHRRPTIVLPTDVYASSAPATRDAVLLHELTHVARADYAWQFFGRLLQAVLWFQPLLWLALRRIEFIRERICDGVSVHGLGDRQTYVDALLQMAARLVERPSPGLSLAVARSTKLGERLAALCRDHGHGGYRLSGRGRAALALAALALVGALGHAAVAENPLPRLPGLPEEAAVALSVFEAESDALLRRAREEVKHKRERLLAKLQTIQDEHTRAANLDAAVAVRDQIRLLRGLETGSVPTTLPVPTMTAPYPYGPETVTIVPQAPQPATVTIRPGGVLTPPAPAPPAPYDMSAYRDRVGETVRFVVKGAADGSVWGTDLYTHDSHLAAAAVHAGAVAPGETAVVDVIMYPPQKRYVGATRHGVRSFDWNGGGYAAYQVRRADPTDVSFTPTALSDPGTLGDYRQRLGEAFRFRVRGSVDGSVWGTDLYTYDSDLSTAAVHAGTLAPGQEGVVCVTLHPGPKYFSGSTAHGVTTSGWDNAGGHYTAFRVTLESALPRGVESSRTSPGMVPAATGPLSDPADLMGYRGQIGRQIKFQVTGDAGGGIWGSDVYTDDSTLAAVAVHAGILQIGEQGCVLVTILPGLSSYRGTRRHGVLSSDFGPFGGSYTVSPCDDTPDDPGGVTRRAADAHELRDHVGPQTLPPAVEGRFRDSDAGMSQLRDYKGESFYFEIVGDRGGDYPSLWGTDFYTDDSSLATAAVHAGALKHGERGWVCVTISAGRYAYQGSTRNGVASRDWSSFGGSFQVRKATPQEALRHAAMGLMSPSVAPQPTDERRNRTSIELRTRRLELGATTIEPAPGGEVVVRSSTGDMTQSAEDQRHAAAQAWFVTHVAPLVAEEQKLLRTYGDRHPRVQEIRAQINAGRAAADAIRVGKRAEAPIPNADALHREP